MPKKILLADDSITIQKVVELTFSDGDYEVSAVNNGAKAIQKLSDLRPDIILSDIIMPEKNGYEVCEYVKSHPEFRNIPVILLTGTFEPFDPDRADKAGCDAVVTKPFESQSLIQKVEELIAAAQNAPPAAPPAEPEPESFAAEASPWEEEPPAPPEAPAFQAHDADIFSAPPATEPQTIETPFDSGGFGAETRAFPRMSFDELQQLSGADAPEPAAPPPPEPPLAPPAAPAAEPSPWDEPPAFGGETRAFPRMSFEELQQMAAPTPEPPPPPMPEPPAWEPAMSPFDAVEPTTDRGTQAFPQLSLEELEQAAAAAQSPFAAPEPPPAPEPPAAPAEEPSPWDQPPAFAGETRAFPRMSFEELQQMAGQPAATPELEPPPAPAEEPSPWDEQPSRGAEARAFPSMSFEELQTMTSEPAAAPAEETSPWDEPVEESVPTWSPAEEPPPAVAAESFAAESFATEMAAPFAESLEPQEAPFEPEMTSPVAAAPEEPAWTPSQPEPLVNPQITDTVNEPPAAASADLTDDQIDRIARRVVQLMSEQVVRNIAWEVIPDLAEIVVKERIRELESEA